MHIHMPTFELHALSTPLALFRTHYLGVEIQVYNCYTRLESTRIYTGLHYMVVIIIIESH